MSQTFKKDRDILLVVNKLLEEIITDASYENVIQKLLRSIIIFTGCEYGFIALLHDLHSPSIKLKTIALSKLNKHSRHKELYQLHRISGLSYKELLTYFGQFTYSHNPIILNEIKNIPDSTKSETMTLSSYLGIPIEIDDNRTVLIGLANKPGGYNQKDLNCLRYVKSCVVLITKKITNDSHSSTAHKDIRKIRDRLKYISEESAHGLWEWNLTDEDQDWESTKSEWWSPQFYNLLGYDVDEIPANLDTFLSLIHPNDKESTFEKFHIRHVGDEFDVYDIKHRLRKKDGSYRWFRSKGKLFKDQNNVVYRMLGSISDIQNEYNLAEKLAYQSTHDDLTGLYNRRAFLQKLSAITRSPASKKIPIVTVLDIDQFKLINDTKGSQVGDEVIKFVSSSIKNKTEKNEVFARIDGDEFGLIMEEYTVDDALTKLDTIKNIISQEPYHVKDDSINFTLSIGVCPVDKQQDNVEEILAAANLACNEAKASGTNLIRVFSAKDTEFRLHKDKLHWINRIRTALRKKQIMLFVQPIKKISKNDTLTNSNASHYEVLARLKENEDQYIPPSQFMPIVERFGIAVEFDRYIINTFCKWYAQHVEAIPSSSKFSINLSGQSLSDMHLLALIIRNLYAFDIPPEKICIEITESAAISDIHAAKQFIEALRKQGLSFSLDDFGQGLSSLTYLKELPVDFLKIDGAFIKGLEPNTNDYSLVKSINHIAHSFGYRTVAECVDNERTLKLLLELDIDYAQGFIYGKPLPISSILNEDKLKIPNEIIRLAE